MSCFWQIGDGFWNQRSAPVTVHGLNSGVLFLAAGAVRLLNCFDIEPDAWCVCFILAFAFVGMSIKCRCRCGWDLKQIWLFFICSITVALFWVKALSDAGDTTVMAKWCFLFCFAAIWFASEFMPSNLIACLCAAWSQPWVKSKRSCYCAWFAHRSSDSCCWWGTFLFSNSLYLTETLLPVTLTLFIHALSFIIITVIILAKFLESVRRVWRFWMQYHSCVILSGGAVRCWGHNHVGEVLLFALF